MPLSDTAPSADRGGATVTPAPLVVSRLGVRLGGLPVLRDVSLTAPAGQMTALLGGNGSGKTTLLRTLLRLVPHQSGAITWFGVPQAEFKDWPRLGYVPQKPGIALHATTLAEVVQTGTLGRRLSRRQARRLTAAALDQVGLADQGDELFLHLSGGQQQRALLARALTQEPDVLVLDEPLAGVDLVHQSQLHDLLAAAKAAAVTIIIVLHETDMLADLIDHAVVLREGRVIHDGPLPPSGGESAGHEHEPPLRSPGLVTGIEVPWTS